MLGVSSSFLLSSAGLADHLAGARAQPATSAAAAPRRDPTRTPPTRLGGRQRREERQTTTNRHLPLYSVARLTRTSSSALAHCQCRRVFSQLRTRRQFLARRRRHVVRSSQHVVAERRVEAQDGR